MGIVLYEFIEDFVLDQILVKLLLLLVVIGFKWSDCQLIKILQGYHLLLEILFYKLQADESSYFIEDGMFGTDGKDAFADTIDEKENDFQSHQVEEFIILLKILSTCCKNLGQMPRDCHPWDQE